MRIKIHVLLFLLLLFIKFQSYPQILPLKRVIRNFLPKEYMGHNQVWCATMDQRGIMYFGTAECVLEYDGSKWRNIFVQHGVFVHSMAISNEGEIFIGSFNDFGKLEPAGPDTIIREGKREFFNRGNLVFKSLKDKIHWPDEISDSSDTYKNFGAIWSTVTNREGIFYNAKKYIFHLHLNRVNVITAINPGIQKGKSVTNTDHEKFFKIFKVNNRLLAEHNTLGILIYNNHKFELLPGTELFANQQGIYSIIPFPASGETGRNSMLFITLYDGIFQYNTEKPPYVFRYENFPGSGKNPLFLYPQNEPFKQENQPYGGIKLKDGNILINTVYNGIEIFGLNKDEETGWFNLSYREQINRESGLTDNCVYNAFTSESENSAGDLWLCLENGISRINYPGQTSFYDFKDGIEGTVYDITEFKGRIYLATSNGVYYSLKNDELSKHPDKLFSKIKEINDQCWNFIKWKPKKNDTKPAPQELLMVAASLSGMYAIDSLAGYPVFPNMTYCLSVSPLNDSTLYAGGNQGLFEVHPFRNRKKYYSRWKNLLNEKEVIEVVGITTIKEKDENGQEKLNLWISTRLNGMIHLKINHESMETKEIYGPNEGLPDGDIWTFPFELPGKETILKIGTRKGLFRMIRKPNESDKKTAGSQWLVLSDSSFGKTFSNPNTQVFRFYQGKNRDNTLSSTECWIHTGTGRINHCKKNDSGWEIDSISFKNLNIGEIYSIYPSHNRITWFGGTDGLIRYDEKIKKNYSPVYHTLIRRVSLTPSDSIIFNGTFSCLNNLSEKTASEHFYNQQVCLIQPEEMIPLLQYSENNLRFEFSAPFFEREEKTVYRYTLEGYDRSWSEWSPEKTANYTNLDAGTYCFNVNAKNIFGHESSTGKYNFIIHAPFYQTAFFYAVQTLFVLLLFGISIWFAKKRTESGIRGRISSILLTLVLYIIFEYCNTFLEKIYLGGQMGNIVIIRILYGLGMALVLFPIEQIVKTLIYGGGFKNVIKGKWYNRDKEIMERGYESGKDAGIKEKLSDWILFLKKEGKSKDEIEKITGLRKDEIEKL